MANVIFGEINNIHLKDKYRQNKSKSTYALFCNGNQKILMLEIYWLT